MSADPRIDQDSIILCAAAEKIAAEKKVSFGEALNIARRQLSETQPVNIKSPYLPAAPGSVELHNDAVRLAREKGISFCEALPIAREIHMAAQVVDAEQLKETVQGALQNFFVKLLQGREEVVIDANDVFQAGMAISGSLRQISLGSRISDALKTELTGFMDGLINGGRGGIVNASDVDSIIADATDRLAKAYDKELAALRG